MTCPRCKREHDVLQYIRLEESPEFDLETTPVYKCPSCKWIFAPAGAMEQEVYEKLYQEMQSTLKGILEKVNK